MWMGKINDNYCEGREVEMITQNWLVLVIMFIHWDHEEDIIVNIDWNIAVD